MKHEEVASVGGIETADALHGIKQSAECATDSATQEVPHALDPRVVHRAPRDEGPAVAAEAAPVPVLGLNLADQHTLRTLIEADARWHVEHVACPHVVPEDGLCALVQMDLPKVREGLRLNTQPRAMQNGTQNGTLTHLEPHDLTRVAVHAPMDLWIQQNGGWEGKL